MVVNDLSKGKNCSGTTLVALSCVRKLENLLLQVFLFERLDKGKKSKKFQNLSSFGTLFDKV